jgi:hypothetical protein
MNKQILKLAKESGISFGGHPMNPLNVYPSELEKFAELIVRECVDIVSKVPNGYRDYRNQIEDAMRADCLQAIQEHFGVKL